MTIRLTRLQLAVLELGEDLIQAHAPVLVQLGAAHARGAQFRHLAGAALVRHRQDVVTGIGGSGQTQHLHRDRGTGGLDGVAGLVEHGPHPAVLAAADDHVAAPQRSGLHQDGGHRAAALVQAGFHDGPAGGAVHRRLEFQHLGLQQDGVEQVVDALAGLGGHLDQHGVAAPGLGQDIVLGELLHDPVRVGVGLVHLIDGDHDRHAGGPGVLDRLDGLGHDPVVSRHHQHHDVRDLGAAGPHGREGGVTGGVQEGDDPAAGLHMVGADVLGDAAGLAGGDPGAPDVSPGARSCRGPHGP